MKPKRNCDMYKTYAAAHEAYLEYYHDWLARDDDGEYIPQTESQWLYAAPEEAEK